MSIIPSRARDRWRRLSAPVLFLGILAVYLSAPHPKVPAGESLRLVCAAEGWEPWRIGDPPLYAYLAGAAAGLAKGNPAAALRVLSAATTAASAVFLFLILGSYVHNRTPEELFHEPFSAPVSLIPAFAVTLAYAFCSPVWHRGTAISADGLKLFLFGLFAWSIVAAKSGKLRYLFLAGFVYALGAPSNRILLYSLPGAVLFLLFGVRGPWWKGRPLQALGGGVLLGIALCCLPFLSRGSDWARLTGGNLRAWTLGPLEPETVLVRVEVPDPFTPGLRKSRLTAVPAVAVEHGSLETSAMGGIALFMVALFPLLLVAWNWRGDMKREKTPRDTVLGRRLRHVLFFLFTVGGWIFFRESGFLETTRVGGESAAVPHAFFVTSLWLAYCVGYWLILLGSPPARYRKKRVDPRRIVLGRGILAIVAVLFCLRGAGSVAARLRTTAEQGLDGHLRRVRETVSSSGDAGAVLLLTSERDLRAWKIERGQTGETPEPATGSLRLVSLEDFFSIEGRRRIFEETGLSAGGFEAGGTEGLEEEVGARIARWAEKERVYIVRPVPLLRGAGLAAVPAGVVYRVLPSDRRDDDDAVGAVVDRAAALWDRWFAEGARWPKELYVSYSRILNDLAAAAWSAGRAETARTGLERSVALLPENLCAWYNLSRIARESGDDATADRAHARYAILRAEIRSPSDWLDRMRRDGAILLPEAHVDVGEFRLGEGRFREAAWFFEEALRLEPGLRRARLGLGRARLGMGDVPSAAAGAEELLADDPGDPDALVLLAQVRIRQGRPEEADDLLRRALKTESMHAKALYVRGRLLLERGKPREALRLLENLVLTHPSDRDFLVALARAQLAYEQYHRCESTADRILRRYGPDAEARALRGLALLGQGRLREAGNDFAAALSVDRTVPDALWGEGEVCRRREDPEGMRRWWRRFLETAPEDPRAPAVRKILDDGRR